MFAPGVDILAACGGAGALQTSCPTHQHLRALSGHGTAGLSGLPDRAYHGTLREGVSALQTDLRCPEGLHCLGEHGSVSEAS